MQKRIYWRKDEPRNREGKMYADIRVIGGYDHSLAAFLKLGDILKKDFPLASDQAIECGVIQSLRDMKMAAIVKWSVFLPDGDYPGWDQNPVKAMDYC